jgi:hypothetical protein
MVGGSFGPGPAGHTTFIDQVRSASKLIQFSSYNLQTNTAMCRSLSSTQIYQDRFWPKVDKTQSGWIWTCWAQRFWIWIISVWEWMHGAHRVAWIFAFGHPGELQVLHKCDRRRCVNPTHLFLRTNKDNVADRVSKGRSSSSKGERHGRAKLHAADIPAIRQRLASGDFQKDIARDYGVSQPRIGYLARGETWHAVQ